MSFGEEVDDERLLALLRPDARISTVLTADVYGVGEADRVVARALEGLPRESYALVGAVGHDFVGGERQGAKGFPRFTAPALRGPGDYAGYLRAATEASLERCGVDRFDALLLHNPDRTGYRSEAVWDGMAALRDAGLTDAIGVAPGPANGFTLDLLHCLERFGDRIDWAMLIMSPLEPWPARLALPACARHDVEVIARVVDYGGLLWGDLTDAAQLGPRDHRAFRPAGWIDRGGALVDALRPIGERHGLTPLQLAAAWDLAHAPVRCVVPTLLQERGEGVRPVEAKREELAGVTATSPLSAAEVEEIAALGDNTGSMALKGSSPEHEGDELPDRWHLDDEDLEVARRWAIDPARDLVKSA